MAKKNEKKPAPASKNTKPAKNSVKPSSKSTPEKSTPPPAAAKPEAKPAAKPAVKPAPGKAASRADLRSSILAKRGAKAAKPIAFSLDDVRELVKTTSTSEGDASAPVRKDDKAARAAATAAALDNLKTAKPQHVQAASLADILGFNPRKAAAPVAPDDDSSIPEKFRRYYKLLLELRQHLLGQIDTHSEETLKRSAKDDSGDLSSYGQHMADAGTDTFDRDFALSLVSSEQEALAEIEAAIRRIKNGTYGICEITQKPIAKERLLAVPFTRYSAEAQKEIEKNRHRSRQQAGLFGEGGEDVGKIMDDSGDDE